MAVDAADEEPRAADYGFADVRKGDSDIVEEEIKDRVEIVVGIGGEELGMHVEDAADGGALDAHGGEAVLDGLDGGERGGAEVGVEG